MRRILISVFACFFAALFVSWNLAAQPSPGFGEAFRQEGIASWYGPQFDGRLTASGEIFDATLFTAAHPHLPFGTILTVTNRANNRQVSVRVNDRGPFVEGRIIDVSQAAAEYLGMMVTGTASVIIEEIRVPGQQPALVMTPAPVQAPVPAPTPVVEVQPQQHTGRAQVVEPVIVQTPVQQVPPVQTPAPPQGTPVHVGTTTIPLEVLPNVPITINIFHAPHDFSQPTTVVTSPVPGAVTVTPQPETVTVAPEVQRIPEIVLLPNGQHGPEPGVPPVTGSPVSRAVPHGAVNVPPVVIPAEEQPPVVIPPPPRADLSHHLSHLWDPPEQETVPVPPPPVETPPTQPPVIALPPPPPPVQLAVPIMNVNPNGVYRVQVGSFRIPRNAVDTFVRLSAHDFSPSYERSGEFWRVVLSGIRGTEVQSTVEELTRLGYHGLVVTTE